MEAPSSRIESVVKSHFCANVIWRLGKLGCERQIELRTSSNNLKSSFIEGRGGRGGPRGQQTDRRTHTRLHMQLQINVSRNESDRRLGDAPDAPATRATMHRHARECMLAESIPSRSCSLYDFACILHSLGT